MSVTIKVKLTCTEHPKYTGKGKNKAVKEWEDCGCYEVYNYQRKDYWGLEADVTVEIKEVQHNG